MKIKFNLKEIINKLNPPPVVGGLEITDSSLRYVLLKGNDIKKAVLRLPPDIIKGGVVKNKGNFISALKKLREQLSASGWRSKKPLNIILSISSASVYTQIFNLPVVASQRLEEAARLNLRMISPIDVDHSYYDWEMVGEDELERGKFDLLGAFADARVIDEFTGALHEANFVVSAIEPSAMSLARTLRNFLGEDLTKPYSAFNLTGDGLDFFILRNGKLHFNYFVSWRTVSEKEGVKQADIEIIKKVIITELRRLTNFYTSKWGDVIKDLILVSPNSNRELVKEIGDNFQMKVHNLPISSKKGLDVNWAPVFGAALRGLVPREKDNFISLASVGTEIKFQQSRVFSFFLLWRNIVLTAVAAFFVIYGILDTTLVFSQRSLERELGEVPAGINTNEVADLQKKATEFNALLGKALLANQLSANWSSVFTLIRNVASVHGVTINQIKLHPETMVVDFGGSSATERSVINFKNALIERPEFSSVDLPLTSIKVSANGTASFNVSFKLVESVLE